MRGLGLAAWISFTLLLLVLAQQFLFACGIHIGSYTWRACPIAPDCSQLIHDVEEGDRLQRLVHLAELHLAEKPPCDSPPRPAPRPRPNNDEDIGRERLAAKGKLEVFLRCFSYDDLDLIIDCPGGTMGGRGNPRSGVCGDGRVDLDANRNVENVTSTPVEHAVWQDPPGGTYKFKVHLFKSAKNERQDVPFRLTIMLDGKETICEQSISFFPKSEGRIAKNGKIFASYFPQITWQKGTPLPACN